MRVFITVGYVAGIGFKGEINLTVSEQNRFPRLGNYPQDATKKELVEYVEELIEWCQGVEETFCNHERPPRKVFCQLPKGHEGSHQAIIYWEDE